MFTCPLDLILRLKYAAFLILAFCCLSHSFAQVSPDKELDSFRVIMAMPDDTIKVLTLQDLADWSTSQNAMTFTQSALELSEKIGYDPGVVRSWQQTGNIHYNMGEYPQALEAYMTEIRLMENAGLQKYLSAPYGGIGNVLIAQEQYEEAIVYYEKGLRVVESRGPEQSQNCKSFYINLGGANLAMGELDKAEKWFYSALDVALLQNGDYYHLGDIYNGLGETWLKREQPDSARKYFMQALFCYTELNMVPRVSLISSNLGLIELLEKNNTQAIAYFKQAIADAETENIREVLKMSWEGLSDAYAGLGDYQAALESYKKYIAIKDELFNESNSTIIQEMATKYESDQDEKKIALLNKDKKIADADRKQKSLILTATLTGLVLVVIFAFFVLNRFHVTRRQKNIIESQKTEVELQKELIEEKNKEITDSIQYAKRIQSAILPPLKEIRAHLGDSFVLYLPKDIVAGDFYWFETVPVKNLVMLAAADCTGHGVPGALISVVCHNALNRAVREYGLTEPGKILDKTREIILNEFKKSETDVNDGMDISLCVLEQGAQRRLHFAGAYNPAWLLRSAEITELKADKQPVGRFDHPRPFQSITVELQKGDCIYLFSDGYADQFGGSKGKKLKTSGLREVLLKGAGKEMAEQEAIFKKYFSDWKSGFEQIDDVCVIGFRIS